MIQKYPIPKPQLPSIEQIFLKSLFSVMQMCEPILPANIISSLTKPPH